MENPSGECTNDNKCPIQEHKDCGYIECYAIDIDFMDNEMWQSISPFKSQEAAERFVNQNMMLRTWVMCPNKPIYFNMNNVSRIRIDYRGTIHPFHNEFIAY